MKKRLQVQIPELAKPLIIRIAELRDIPKSRVVREVLERSTGELSDEINALEKLRQLQPPTEVDSTPEQSKQPTSDNRANVPISRELRRQLKLAATSREMTMGQLMEECVGHPGLSDTPIYKDGAKSNRTNVPIPRHSRQHIKIEAARRGVTMKTLVDSIVSAYLNR